MAYFVTSNASLANLRSPMFLVNSYLGLVTATPFVRRHPFSQSYGAIFLNSLKRFVSRPKVFSTYPPVSISDIGTFLLKVVCELILPESSSVLGKGLFILLWFGLTCQESPIEFKDSNRLYSSVNNLVMPSWISLILTSKASSLFLWIVI